MFRTPVPLPALVLLLLAAAPARAQGPEPRQPGNPYGLSPFVADFPVALEYPNRYGREYDRSRRQMIEQLVSNLQGNVRAEAWQMATEFFWRAPADAREPLIAAMDRAYGQPALGDFVRNCVEAMGKMADERFDAALRRALEHKNPQVVQAAFAALGNSSTEATLRGLQRFFTQMDGRARSAWLRALCKRLGTDAAPILRDLLAANYPDAARDQIVAAALELPPVAAAEVLRPGWPAATGKFKAVVAGVLHAAGDAAGTAWLRDALSGQDLTLLQLALEHVGSGDLGLLAESVLQHSAHVRADVRLAVAKALVGREGDDVLAVFETMTAPDEAFEVKAIALRELSRRGRPAAVELVIDELATATGTRAQVLLHLLTACGDPAAVPVFVERFRKAPPGEGRPFLQALSQIRGEAAARALLELFAGEERLVAKGAKGDYTTRNYVPTLLLNVRGGERVVADAFAALPADDAHRRAALMATLAGYAADREDTALQAACIAPVRAVLFDRGDLPQLRVLALNLLTLRWLTVEDALRLKNERFEEKPGLRALFADFLNDYF